MTKTWIRRPTLGPNALAAACMAVCLQSCQLFFRTGYPLPGFQGVEDPQIASQACGTIAWVSARDDGERLHAFDLASGELRTFSLDDTPIAISGPDENGDVALLESGGLWRPEHRIVLVSLVTGESRTVLEGRGKLVRWQSTLGLAPRGGRIAFIRTIDLVSYWGGQPSLDPEMVIVDTQGTKTKPLPIIRPGSTQPHWFADGRRFVYVEKNSDMAPTETWIVDVESGARQHLGRGVCRALSADGTSALLDDSWDYDVATGPSVRLDSYGYNALAEAGEYARFGWCKELRLLDTKTGYVLDADVPLPGPDHRGYGRVFALVHPGLVLHEGLPPLGELQFLIHGLPGPHGRYPIRLTDAATGSSAIVLEQTWNWTVSYGTFEFGSPMR